MFCQRSLFSRAPPHAPDSYSLPSPTPPSSTLTSGKKITAMTRWGSTRTYGPLLPLLSVLTFSSGSARRTRRSRGGKIDALARFSSPRRTYSLTTKNGFSSVIPLSAPSLNLKPGPRPVSPRRPRGTLGGSAFAPRPLAHRWDEVPSARPVVPPSERARSLWESRGSTAPARDPVTVV